MSVGREFFECSRYPESHHGFQYIPDCSQLDEEEKVNVLKCVYIGLAVPENNGKLLRWFKELSESSGIGTVVRAVNSL